MKKLLATILLIGTTFSSYAMHWEDINPDGSGYHFLGRTQIPEGWLVLYKSKDVGAASMVVIHDPEHVWLK